LGCPQKPSGRRQKFDACQQLAKDGKFEGNQYQKMLRESSVSLSVCRPAQPQQVEISRNRNLLQWGLKGDKCLFLIGATHPTSLLKLFLPQPPLLVRDSWVLAMIFP
jgi:hypothetical protein